MGGIQEYARKYFAQEARFLKADTDVDLDLIEIYLYPSDSGPALSLTRLNASNLITEATKALPERDGRFPLSSFRLVRISRELDSSLRIPESTFREIFEAFNLEPYMLYLIQNGSYGF